MYIGHVGAALAGKRGRTSIGRLGLLGALLSPTRAGSDGRVISAGVLSPIFLDGITGYKPTWPGGPMIGLKLYDHPVADFVAEAVVIAIGALLYARTLPPRKR